MFFVAVRLIRVAPGSGWLAFGVVRTGYGDSALNLARTRGLSIARYGDSALNLTDHIA